MAHLQANYQPVIIKSLLENESMSKDDLILKIRELNPELTKQQEQGIPVFNTKVIQELTELNDEKKFSLRYRKKEKEETEHLKQICDEWIDNVKYKSEIEGLSAKGVSQPVIAALLKFWKLGKRGAIKSRDSLSNPSKEYAIPKEEQLEEMPEVNGNQILHGMVKGVYKAAGEEFPQALMMRPKSKWGLEISRTHPTLRINYDFEDHAKYTAKGNNQIGWMEKCQEKGIPIAIIFGYATNKWMILGLCKIVERPSLTHFVLDSYGISDEKSAEIKEKALKNYDTYHTADDLKNVQSIEWEKIFSDVKIERFEGTTENTPKLKQGEVKISDIISRIDAGTIAIPRFQRYYQWRPSQVRDLLDSIFHEFFVGNLFLWDVEDNDRERCGITPVEGSDIPYENLKGDEIVIDGQQRITSLYYAIKAPDKKKDLKKHPGYFYINFNSYFQNDDEGETILRFDNKIEDQETFDRLLFPFYYLDTTQRDLWITNLRKFIRKNNQIDNDNLERYMDVIRNKTSRFYSGYTLLQIEISNVNFDNVANIFQKINTTGTPLDVFDLIIVKMWVHKVDVKNLWEKTVSKYPKLLEYDHILKTKMGRYIMESMALSFSKSKSCKRADILNMFADEKWNPQLFTNMWDETSLYINKAIETLESKSTGGFGAITSKILPYEPILPILASIIREIETNFKDDQPNCYEKLNQWYWTSVFAKRYSDSVEAKKTSDYKEIVEWFKDSSKIPRYVVNFQKQFKNLILGDETRGAIYNGIMCILAMKGALDLEIRVSTKDKTPHMDHIFPKSKITYREKNSILNMTWLSSETNVGTKKDRMPSKYIEEVKNKKYNNDKSKILNVLSSHLISEEGYSYLIEDKFDEFIESRQKEILKEIANKIGAIFDEEIDDDVITQTSKNTPFGNKLVLRNVIESCNNEILWVSKYFGNADFKTLYVVRGKLNVKKIRMLTSKHRADENLKSDFKSFKKEMSENHQIECEMRVMSKDVESEIHARYLTDSEKCFNIIDSEIALRGQSDDVSPCKKPANIEKWWNESYDILNDWNKFHQN